MKRYDSHMALWLLSQPLLPARTPGGLAWSSFLRGGASAHRLLGTESSPRPKICLPLAKNRTYQERTREEHYCDRLFQDVPKRPCAITTNSVGGPRRSWVPRTQTGAAALTQRDKASNLF